MPCPLLLVACPAALGLPCGLSRYFFFGFFLAVAFLAAGLVALAGVDFFLPPLEKMDSQFSEYFLFVPTRTTDTVHNPFKQNEDLTWY